MRLPTWEELRSNTDQLDVLEHPLNEPLFVAGPPGSGKTVLAVRRASALVEDLQATTLVTYNRMLRRLVSLLDSASGFEARTMHSFAWRDCKKRTGCEPPKVPHSTHRYDWVAMLQASPADAAPRGHLVIDEGQDLPAGFFEYARRYAIGLSVFADENQALRDDRTTLEQIQRAARLPNPKLLRDNHRNSPEISRLAEHFHGGRLPVARVLRPSGRLPRLVQSAGLEETAQLVANVVENMGNSVGIVAVRNETVRVISSRMKQRLPEHRVHWYDSDSQNEDSVNPLEPGCTVLNKESVKGQEFDTVFLLELEELLPCRSETERRVMYMLCTRARDDLLLVPSSRGLSTEQEACLPGPDILERG